MSAPVKVPATVQRRPSLFTRLLALAAPETFSEPLVQADYALELTRTAHVVQTSVESTETTLAALRLSTVQRLRRLRHALLVSSMSMASAVAVAYFFRTSGIAPMLPRPVLAVGSLFSFATATLARLGWGGQRIKEITSVEQVDQRLFHVLYWIGMCWGALAIL